MKILHLSDTTLSGSPIRLSNLYAKYSEHESRYITSTPVIQDRVFPCDMVADDMTNDELEYWLDWADILHFHNRWKRQEIFQRVPFKYKKKPSLIQIHSPRLSEDFTQEVKSKKPLAIISQYHPREWKKELKYIIPNVVDIYDDNHICNPSKYGHASPIVGYAPSNWNAKGWDNKGYGFMNDFLKRLEMFKGAITYQRIIRKPWLEAMFMKQSCHVGIDEVVTGSYHLSSLEFLAMGCATFAYLDEQTEAVCKETIGADHLPWINVQESEFKSRFRQLLQEENWDEIGIDSRKWMEKYYDPRRLCEIYTNMYTQVLENQS